MNKSIVIVFFFFLTTTSFSQDEFCETIVVQGKSMISMTPEIVNFNINFTVKDSSFVRCSELALEKINEIKNQFIENDIDTNLVKTISYYVREEMRYDERIRQQISDGYIAGIPLSVKSRLDNPTSNKIFEVIKNNFKSNLNISFELSENQIKKIKDELIKLAVEDATSKAKTLTESLNIELGSINKIQYGDPNFIRNFTRSNYDLVSSMQLETLSSTAQINFNTLTPAEIVMSTNVMLAWSIKK